MFVDSEVTWDAGCRWMVLDDQNLCIQTSSSFIYGALPIRGDIYVVGDLDTGQWAPRPPAAPAARMSPRPPCLQEPTSTTSGSFAAARGGGTAPCPCCPPTCPNQPAPPSASPTVDCSTFSFARECSGSESEDVAALCALWVSGPTLTAACGGSLGGGVVLLTRPVVCLLDFGPSPLFQWFLELLLKMRNHF